MQRRLTSFFAVIAAAALAAAAPARAQDHASHQLGTVDFRASCAGPARAELDRAIALLHHMTYPRAREAFEKASAVDPRCAMAHWGVAMTLFQPLWPTRPGPADLRRGWAEVETARRLGPGTERERALVDAAAAFFADPDSADYWRRIRRWEQAMERAYRAFPDNADVAALYAVSHLAVAPSDSVTSTYADSAAAVLLAVLERYPDHPGAMHYLVHANDTPGREQDSPGVIRGYAAAAPRNPHALHMPTHVYTRQGDWDAVVRGNLLAAEAALAQPAGDRGQFVWDEFPHAIEYLVYAYLQQGADAEAKAQLERLEGTPNLQPSFKTAFHLASTRARFALERHAWSEAMALAPREPASLDWDRFTWPEAVTWFARGLGAARSGKVAEARAAAGRLDSLEAAAGRSGERLFARNIRVLRLGVAGWLAQAEGDGAQGEALLREAAALELATPKHAVTPGPTVPAEELLGDLLLEQHRPADALAAYRRSLELYPGRRNSRHGAEQAARMEGR
jgi:tetratricopeptide (TPR) repeat protein